MHYVDETWRRQEGKKLVQAAILIQILLEAWTFQYNNRKRLRLAKQTSIKVGTNYVLNYKDFTKSQVD